MWKASDADKQSCGRDWTIRPVFCPTEKISKPPAAKKKTNELEIIDTQAKERRAIRRGKRHHVKRGDIHYADIFEVCGGFWLIEEKPDSPIKKPITQNYSSLKEAIAAVKKLYKIRKETQ